MKIIRSKEDMVNLAKELNVRDSWHEPDEQEVGARYVKGRFKRLDNDFTDHGMRPGVVITKENKNYAFINLALLLAWASGFQDRTLDK